MFLFHVLKMLIQYHLRIAHILEVFLGGVLVQIPFVFLDTVHQVLSSYAYAIQGKWRVAILLEVHPKVIAINDNTAPQAPLVSDDFVVRQGLGQLAKVSVVRNFE